MQLRPHIQLTLNSIKADGHTITNSHVMPCGSVLYRLSNFTILKCKACGESLGRLCTSDWEGAKMGRVG